jgi:tetratricopeptide (TPR) repeat protein
MYKLLRLLRSATASIPVIMLCSISNGVVAYKADVVSPWMGTTIEGNKCAGILVAFGPYDYLQRNSFPSELQIVEENHFSTEIENLEAGQTTTAIGDIHYTLSSWPNHHRALNSALRYRLQNMGPWPSDSKVPPAECYLQRAINFSPNDPKPYIMYGLMMHKAGRYDDALVAYQSAIRMLPNDIMTQYNMGLTLIALKKFPEARAVAEKVYAAGMPLPGLKKKLIEAGHWTVAADPAPAKETQKAGAAKVEPPPEKVAPQNEVAKKTPTDQKITP